MTNFYKLILIFFALLLFVSPAKAETGMPAIKMPALQIDIPGLKFSEPTACADDKTKLCVNWMQEYIVEIYKYGVGIVGILATVVMMIGGIIWLTAGGDATRLGEAKAWITASVTGLIIALTSYLILYTVNPDLIYGFSKPLRLTLVQKLEEIAKSKGSGKAFQYASMSCPSVSELTNGVEIYTTGYYQPPWGNDHKSLCDIAMNCSCPSGRDYSNTCGDIFPGFDSYPACKPFPQSTAYCNSGASGKTPTLGTIAAPNCIPFGTKVCLDGKTYTVNDRGSAITGHRIDIWSGNDLDTALKNSGKIVNMKLGSCN